MSLPLGYTMMSEQAGPRDLVSHVVGAEEVGFDFAVSSDTSSRGRTRWVTPPTPG